MKERKSKRKQKMLNRQKNNETLKTSDKVVFTTSSFYLYMMHVLAPAFSSNFGGPYLNPWRLLLNHYLYKPNLK